MSQATTPTVFIVDDDPAIRDSLSLLLETAGHAVECHDSAESFLAAGRENSPGCLILDVRMKQMSGPELHAELVRRGSQLPVIFLTAHGDIPMTVRAIKAGAKDFLTKPINGTELLERVEAALQSDQARHCQQQTLARERQRLQQLTQRENEVMMLALAGNTNKGIAKQLGISYRTVEIHRSRILQKTGAANMLELAQLAASWGLNNEAGANGGASSAE
ncbi:response regulator transcription factor [Propionivibrio limicola]|uniref:response regulator transcription factor n=1 Tax=Propionivibrio limicola TaxID=167645 RepID=UPI0012927B4F|nr:response regulator [Propionivibrio limicola]